MTDKRLLILVNPEVRRRAVAAVVEAPEGFCVRIEPPTKKRIQEEKYHAMVGDIAKQWQFMGQKWSTEDMKRILVDAFSRVMREAGTPLHNEGRIVPSIDGKGFVQLGVQTREFYVGEAAQFIEYLSAFGAENGIVWSNETRHKRAAEAVPA